MRKAELRGSCASLGIDLTRCVALDHTELQDNPKVWWNTELIESIVAEYVKKWDIDAVSCSLSPVSSSSSSSSSVLVLFSHPHINHLLSCVVLYSPYRYSPYRAYCILYYMLYL